MEASSAVDGPEEPAHGSKAGVGVVVVLMRVERFFPADLALLFVAALLAGADLRAPRFVDFFPALAVLLRLFLAALVAVLLVAFLAPAREPPFLAVFLAERLPPFLADPRDFLLDLFDAMLLLLLAKVFNSDFFRHPTKFQPTMSTDFIIIVESLH